MTRRALVRLVSALAVTASLGAVTACASLRTLARSYDVADDGLQRQEHDLRVALDGRSFDSALARVRDRDGAAPRDELLREMYGGLVAYYAGSFEASAHSLDRAAYLADDRWTKSIGRGAAALATNDMALNYMPGRTERLLVHYYAMLGYLQRDSAEAAAVEARRLSRLLDQFADGREPRERVLHGTLHYLAGAAFEAAGQRTDADVSYRNAAQLLGGDSVAIGTGHSAALTVDSAPAHPSARRAARAALKPAPAPPRPAVVRPPTGDVVVVVEWGFVAHRVQHDFAMVIDSGDVAALAVGTAVDHDGESAFTRVMRQIDRREHDGYRDGEWRDARGRRSGHRGISIGDADDRLLYVAWPALERPEPTPTFTSIVADSSAVPVHAHADLSDAASADYDRDRAAVITRAIVRAAVKYSATRVAKKKGGDVAKIMVGAGSALLERADTRSWQLLPGQVAVTRLTLPVGIHRLSLDLPGAGGRVDVGEVTVVPGQLRVTAVRLWRGGPAVAGVPIPFRAPAIAVADSAVQH